MKLYYAAGILAALALSGCAQDVFYQPGITQAQFNVDMGNCQMFALGQPQYRPAQLPPSYTANTIYSGNIANTTITPQSNPNQGFEDFGAALRNRANRQQAMRACMAAKGYTLQP